jgi:hypothetical protein
MHSTTEFEEEKFEFQSVLASGIFNRAPNLAQVLTYVCERYFEGASEQIREYSIAVEALGRPAGFDQKRDSIVRVEAHRLRKRLREYYAAEGAGHSVRIEIPAGQYSPTFVRQAAPQPRLDENPVAPPPLAIDPAPEWTAVQTIAPIHNSISFNAAPPPLPKQRSKERSGAWIAASLTILAISAVFIWKASAAKPGKVSAAPSIGVVPVPSQGIHILAGFDGGAYTDGLGRVWQGDRYYRGGAVFESSGRPIAGARDQRLFVSRREGTFSYDIPLAPGVYELRLYFAETLYGENNMAGGGETSRIFDVYANSGQILEDFDVIREVGASTADIRAFRDISPAADGKLHLRFEPKNNPAMVSAIEVTPGVPGRLLPIRLVSRDHPYTDKQGRIWAADGYSRGGQLVLRTEQIENIGDPELLRGERYGNLTYVIPVPAGRYGITLYFAETWFGPARSAGGGVGSRTFDILCNGVAIRRGFDIFKEAHGAGRAVDVSLHGVEPDPQGKLTISLLPVRNYSSINALEVVDESK